MNYRKVEKVANNPQCVQSGVWYANDHYQAMKIVRDMPKYKASAAKLYEYFVNHKSYAIGYVSPKFFEPIEDTNPEMRSPMFGNKRPLQFLVKKDVIPSEALKAAASGLSLIDCGIFCQINRYGSLLDHLGEKKFNILFGSSSKGQRMNIGYSKDDNNPMRYFVEFTWHAQTYDLFKYAGKQIPPLITGTLGARNVTVGQIVSIRGAENHRTKHPWNHNCSYNMICVEDKPGKQAFVSLGVTASSEQQMNALLTKDYNLPTRWDDKAPELRIAEGVQLSMEYAEHTITALDPEKMEGFQCGSIQEFKVDLILDLINLPEDQVSMEFVRNHRSQKRNMLNIEEVYNSTRLFYWDSVNN
jgi:hypothetical protein